jgi:hypothetical protein
MIGRLVVAVLFGLYIFAQTPHLVHHAFEHDDIQGDCSFLAAAERHHAIPADVAAPVSTPTEVATVTAVPIPAPISHDPGSAGARAPPVVG